MLNFIPFCYWKGVKFTLKKTCIIYVLWAILRCVIDAFVSNLVHAGGGGLFIRKCTCKFDSFL